LRRMVARGPAMSRIGVVAASAASGMGVLIAASPLFVVA
jgi:hypothetical protein